MEVWLWWKFNFCWKMPGAQTAALTTACKSLSLFFFFFLSTGLVRRERGQLRKTGLWMPALPPHCFPLVWSNLSGLWKKWIIILLGDKAEDADTPPTDGQLVRAGQRAGLGRLPFHGAPQQRAGLDSWSQKSFHGIRKILSSNHKLREGKQIKHISFHWI